MSKENSSSIEKIFGSKTRAKLLTLFFENPEKSFYVREITRVIEEQINSVRRELMNLESIGIIKSENFDNKIYYSSNQKHPFFHSFVEIFSKKIDSNKDFDIRRNTWDDLVVPIKKILSGLVVINRLPGQDGIDLLIIGNDRTGRLSRWAEMVEKKQGKPINYSIISKDDFIYRMSVRDRFILDIFDMNISEIIDFDNIIKEVK